MNARSSTRFGGLLAGLLALAATMVALSASIAPVRAASLSYTINDLGTLGGSFSRGNAINARGDVVGSSETSSGLEHAFLYSGGQMKDLGTLSGFTSSIAYAINDNGQIVGDVFNLGFSPGGTSPFTSNGTSMQPLATLGGKGGTARGINGHGAVTGRSAIRKNVEHPAVVSGTSVTDLFPGDDDDATATAINDSGTVVGARFTRSGFRAFMIDNGGRHDLGTLRGDVVSYAKGINNAGQIVGCSSNGSNRSCTAFVYEHGQMTPLGHLPGMTTSEALGINSAGTVVGTTYSTSGPGHAFIWTASNGLQDLNSALPPGSPWTLQSASGINDKGQIAGTGVIGGKTHAFLLTPR